MNNASTVKKTLLVSTYHCYLDPSNGAAITTRELLHALALRGWNVHAFCGCALDFQDERDPLEILKSQGIASERIVDPEKTNGYSLATFRDGSINSTLFLPGDNAHIPSPQMGKRFLSILHGIIGVARPQILATYGSFWLSDRILSIGKINSLKTAFLLQNHSYGGKKDFEKVDLTITPSEYTAKHYLDLLGLPSTPIAPMMDWDRFICDPSTMKRKYVVMINPEPSKGGLLVARIARELWERRPDIPILLVEGRSKASWLKLAEIDWTGVRNLNVMPCTTDPRNYYSEAYLVIVPSYYPESFGRAPVEAMANGIPVIVSSRGALPEVVEDAGVILDISARLLENAKLTPMKEDAEEWVRNILLLWDNKELYEDFSRRARERAQRWRPEIIAAHYDNVLSALIER
ncbi:MAG: glycosyltransferase family 4 protein [Thermoguttaceae bacterium]